MSRGAVGWGIGPPGRGPQGLRADQPPPSTADDLHRIAERYDGPPTFDVQNIGLVTNQTLKFDRTGTAINAVMLTAAAGQINLYFGDYTSGNNKPAVTPHVVATASIVPETVIIPLTPKTDYIFTVQEGAAAAGGATGTIIFLYQ